MDSLGKELEGPAELFYHLKQPQIVLNEYNPCQFLNPGCTNLGYFFAASAFFWSFFESAGAAAFSFFTGAAAVRAFFMIASLIFAWILTLFSLLKAILLVRLADFLIDGSKNLDLLMFLLNFWFTYE